jgi:hypothetical protein
MSDLEKVLDRLAEMLRRLDPRPPAEGVRRVPDAPAERVPAPPTQRTAPGNR